MKDLISRLVKDEVYEFKEPWRATNKSLTIVVPVVAKKLGSRSYVVLEEVKDKVKVIDSGGINLARIEGNVGKPTFIRGGTMLKGATQERATQYGVVVIPQKSEQIPVHCIHATKGIHPGTIFQVTGNVPQPVYSDMLYSRSQGATWSAVSDFHAMASYTSQISFALSEVPSDDLVQTVETVQQFREDLKEILKNIPDYVNQVGTVIIDTDGVAGLEVYDHPDSWKAFSKSIIRSFSEALTREDKFGIFKPDMKAVIPIIHKFLKQLQKVTEEEVFNKNNARTVIVKTEGYVGEYTTLKSKTIHLLVTRKRRQPSKPRRRVQQVQPPRTFKPLRYEDAYTPLYTTTTTPTPAWTASSDWAARQRRKMRKNIQVLNALQHKSKTWTTLKSEVPVAKATLSNRLKELQRIGAVEKATYENGSTRYILTGIGHQLLKSKPKQPDYE